MKEYVSKSMTYGEYAELIDRLLAEGRTTGPEQTESRVEFTKLNRQRMKRIAKTTVVEDSVRETMRGNARPMIWLVITEGWCGDAAQAIPAIEAVAAGSDLVETRYVLRDENPELMDRYLTNGTRSIPKLIALDAETLEELGTWGPRPQAAVDYFQKMKAAGVEKSQISENLQRWYNEDRTLSIQSEFERMVRAWNGDRSAAAGY